MKQAENKIIQKVNKHMRANRKTEIPKNKGKYIISTLLISLAAVGAISAQDKAEPVVNTDTIETTETRKFDTRFGKEVFSQINKDPMTNVSDTVNDPIMPEQDPVIPSGITTSASITTAVQTPDFNGDKVLETVWRYYPLAERAIEVHEGSEMYIDEELVLAVIAVESKGDGTKISSSGALGLMQIIPRWHSESLKSDMKRQGITITDVHSALKDDEINVNYGVHYMQELLVNFNGDYMKAIQGYNMGEGAVKNLVSTYGSRWTEHVYEKTGDPEYFSKVQEVYNKFGGTRF